MKIFLSILILIFSLQASIKADDIRDFEIEGVSIGDSFLEHFSKNTIKCFYGIFDPFLPKISEKSTEKIPTFGEGGGQAGWAKIPTFTENLFCMLP